MREIKVQNREQKIREQASPALNQVRSWQLEISHSQQQA
jgi:hypothetical protein